MSAASKPPFRRILVANRGEIALRVLRSAREMGMETVAVYSEADRNALHVRRADYAVCIGGPAPRDSYLRGDAILDAARHFGAEAIHPGYGFLSENAEFSQACKDAGVCFVGPGPEAVRTMGDKIVARAAAKAAGVPLVPGLEGEFADEELLAAAEKIGYPVMLKAAAGGGGKGIRIVERPEELAEASRLARAEAESAFGDGRVYLEKFVTKPRHVEIQVMGDRHGNVVHYGERECSIQRRNQKLVEESPCVVLDPAGREEMGAAAIALAKSVSYVGAGTVEFLWSGGKFYFLEMNTRLQVEHPITEERFGVDLVKEMFRVAAGEKLQPVPEPRGHAIEVRVNAEDPIQWFPALGTIERMLLPSGPGVRLDSMLYRGLEVTPHYDSMLAKLIVHAEDRPTAIARLQRALEEMRLVGVVTSLPAAAATLRCEEFVSGDYDTATLTRIDRSPEPSRHEVAALAAAVSAYVRSELVDGGSGSAAGSGAGSDRPGPWVLMDRLDRLGGRAR